MLLVVWTILGNIISSVALILSNKWLVVSESFDHMSLLSCFHFYTSFFGCVVLLFFGIFPYKLVNNVNFLLRICLGSLSSTIFMNLNLAHNSVGFYQMSKLACIPFTLFVESVFNVRQQKLTVFMTLSLGLILVGVTIFAVYDLTLNFYGCIWAALAIVSTSLAQVFFAPLQRELKLNALQLLLHTSPILTFGSFASIPLFETWAEIIKTKITYHLVVLICVSCFCAFFLNVTNYLVLQSTSPVSYLVIGHVKTILVIILGGIVFDNAIFSFRVVVGIFVALVGVLLFSYENHRQQQERNIENLMPKASSDEVVLQTTQEKNSV